MTNCKDQMKTMSDPNVQTVGQILLAIYEISPQAQEIIEHDLTLEEKLEQMTLFADTKEEIQDNSAENEELKAQIKELEQSLAEFKAIETSRADEEHSSKIKIEELEQHHKSELERLDREKQEIAENYENKLKELPKAEPNKTPEIKEKGVIKVGVLLEQILAISKEMNNTLAEVDAEKQEQTKQAILMFIQKNIVERFEG